MNIDRFSLSLQRPRLLMSLMTGVLTIALTACGGGSGGGKSKSSSSFSSSSNSSSYAAASIPSNGSGTWPSVKVTGTQVKTLTFEWSPVDGATSYKLEKKQSGVGDWVQVGDGNDVNSTTASDTISVHVHDWINTQYRVRACIDTVCNTNSDIAFTATEMIKTIGYIKASNTDIGDFFGWSIALSADGSTLAVGAPAEDSNAKGVNADGGEASNTSENSGAVYIFVKNETGLWEQEAYLKASNTEQPNLNSSRFLPNDRFGYRVALSDDGNTLAVTALLEDSPSNGINCNENNFETTTVARGNSSSSDPSNTFIMAESYDLGAVYVFNRTGDQWIQKAYVKPRSSLIHLNVDEGMRFGESLALSGDGKTLAVGTKSDMLALSGATTFSSMSSDEGCYEFYPSSISSSSKFSSSSVSSSLSSSVTSSSISSNSTSSATSSITIPGGSFSGAVYIYICGGECGENDKWEEEAHVKAMNSQAGDVFGTSISISTDGNTLAVGAIGEDSIATGVNGDQSDNSCYFVQDELVVNDPACKESRFNPRLDNGATYVFTREDKIWTQEAYLKPAKAYPLTLFGYSVDLSGDGNTLAIGAIGDPSSDTGVNADPNSVETDYLNSGAVYIFNRTGTLWAQESFIKLDVNTKTKQFGQSLSLSQDGNTLAAGSYKDTSNATGIDGDEGSTAADRAGAVFIYKRVGNGWSRKSYVKASNTDADDRFGLNVDLSEDGATMAVGAHRESSNAKNGDDVIDDQSNNSAEASGAVYLY